MSFVDLACSDDDPLFRETHYARYGYERTLLTYMNKPDEFPSTRLQSLPDAPLTDYIQPLSKPVRHFLAASTSELTAFLSRDGYWNCLYVDLCDIEPGKSDVIAVDAIETTIDGDIKLYIALATADDKGQVKLTWIVFNFI
ncbi:hypothetical protein BDF20DRAFT_818722 [Mycotypha africana]|uniref:uncharacterized protein n=1 Tax=Mycotypha africana TaxID=64632 RepID=UPI002300CB48|nr:uncharacterized protein BDF20DRAFT_818722 [Mycotypha africana]KAI8981841.1 hypothetical protein BDF20DRAFT_818722 [Mycotypha africana]